MGGHKLKNFDRVKSHHRRHTATSSSPFQDLVVKKKVNLSDDGEINRESDSFKSQSSSTESETELRDPTKRNDVASVFTHVI